MVIYAAQTRIVPLKAPTGDTLNLPYTGLFFMYKPYPGNRLPLTTSKESPFIARCLSLIGIVLAQVPVTHSQNAHV